MSSEHLSLSSLAGDQWLPWISELLYLTLEALSCQPMLLLHPILPEPHLRLESVQTGPHVCADFRFTVEDTERPEGVYNNIIILIKPTECAIVSP